MTRFRAETDQATRWLAFALTEVEKGFRRISGYKDLPHLTAALERSKTKQPVQEEVGAAAAPLPSPTAPAKVPPLVDLPT